MSPDIIPHWAPPTHAMQIFRYCEQGSTKMLWVSATNPAVSLPDVPRIRKILDNDNLFLAVQDAFSDLISGSVVRLRTSRTVRQLL